MYLFYVFFLCIFFLFLKFNFYIITFLHIQLTYGLFSLIFVMCGLNIKYFKIKLSYSFIYLPLILSFMYFYWNYSKVYVTSYTYVQDFILSYIIYLIIGTNKFTAIKSDK